MPFNKNLLIQLRKKVGSQYKLAVALCDCIEENYPQLKPTITPQTINNWEKGHSLPKIDKLDVLCDVAREYGLEGEKIYILPNTQLF